MKIAVHVLAYNVNRFLVPVLKNIEPHVDKIFIAHSEKPWGYVEESRNKFTNPTTIDDVLNASNSEKIEVVSGDWLTEEDMRNACLDKAKEQGFDWLLTQDADEFYSENSWNQIKKTLAINNDVDLFKTTWYNFWKSSQYVLMYNSGSIKGTNTGFALRCKPNLRFTKKRMTNAQVVRVMDCPCYHYGYVMSDTEMKEKLLTWGHATEFNSENWFKYKWLNWDEFTLYLHPTNPAHWLKAIRFPLEQPEFAEEFSLPIHQESFLGFSEKVNKSMYDIRIEFSIRKRNFKKWIR